MKVISLQSGSNGNCIYVEAGDARLLFDAGISGRQAQMRLETHGRDIASVDALLISHDHSDHARCAGIYHRKFGVPVFATEGTFNAAARKYPLGRMAGVRHFQPGETLQFGSVSVETVRTAHDSTDGVAFVVDDGSHRLGILTDLGHVFDGLASVIGTLDAVMIESNYDPRMLANGPYPPSLKDRIKGPGGHISNVEASQLLREVGGTRMRWACLAHLSEENNDPALALRTHRDALGDGLELRVASRYGVSEILNV